MDPVKTASEFLGNGPRPVGQRRNTRQKLEVTSPVGNKDLGMTLSLAFSLTPTGNNDFDMIYVKIHQFCFGPRFSFTGLQPQRHSGKLKRPESLKAKPTVPGPPRTWALRLETLRESNGLVAALQARASNHGITPSAVRIGCTLRKINRQALRRRRGESSMGSLFSWKAGDGDRTAWQPERIHLSSHSARTFQNPGGEGDSVAFPL